MISKNSFFKLQLEDLKRRIWAIALSMLGFFVLLPLSCAITLGSNQKFHEYRLEWLENNLLEVIGVKSPLLFVLTIAGAIILGLSGFFYLHSKKKVDLFHSIPVRRETLFSFNYINGLLIYLVPFVINMIISLIILMFNNVLNRNFIAEALLSIVVHFAFFALVYTTVVIAVMLTGNFVISCFGIIVLLSYGPLLALVKDLFFEGFFNTYYQTDTITMKLSPIFFYFETINNRYSDIEQNLFMRIVFTLVVTVLLIGAAMMFYRKRPSEVAGKAMTFSISKPIIKFLLVLPISLGGGIIFRKIPEHSSLGWYIFGLFFSLLLSYVIIEICYNMDIRCAFRHRNHLIISSIIVIVISVFFHYDILGYDSYIPKNNSIKSMGIYIEGLEYDSYFYDFYSFRNYSSSRPRYVLDNMELKNYESAYQLAKLGIEKNKNQQHLSYHDSLFYIVKYNLKNGREVYRRYQIDSKDGTDLVNQLYDNVEFIKGFYQIYHLQPENINWIECYNMMDNMVLDLDLNKTSQLLEIYKEEFEQISYQDFKNPIASIMFNRIECYVYPSFNKTIQFLAENGFDAMGRIDVDDMEKIEVIYYNYPFSNSITISYTDKNKIEEIYENISSSTNILLNNKMFFKVDTNVHVYITTKPGNKKVRGGDYLGPLYFDYDNIPDFVKSDIGYQED